MLSSLSRQQRLSLPRVSSNSTAFLCQAMWFHTLLCFIALNGHGRFSVCASKQWNSLPCHIHFSDLKVAKCLLKTHLSKKYVWFSLYMSSIIHHDNLFLQSTFNIEKKYNSKHNVCLCKKDLLSEHAWTCSRRLTGLEERLHFLESYELPT